MATIVVITNLADNSFCNKNLPRKLNGKEKMRNMKGSYFTNKGLKFKMRDNN